MNEEMGFRKENFICEKFKHFECFLCQNVCKHPMECSKCQILACGGCIKLWSEASPHCPSGCRSQEFLFEKPNKILSKIYDFLLYLCPKCGVQLRLKDLESHNRICLLRVCKRFPFCNKNKAEGQDYCDTSCYMAVLMKTNRKQINFENRMIDNNFHFTWAKSLSTSYIEFSDDLSTATIRNLQGTYCNILGNTFLSDGCFYWEIKAELSQNSTFAFGVFGSSFLNLKEEIPISCLRKPFWEKNLGFAIGNDAIVYLNKSVVKSKKIIRMGSRFTLGCLFNSFEGSLKFYLNGKEIDQSIKDPNLKKNNIFVPAAYFTGYGKIALSTGLIPRDEK